MTRDEFQAIVDADAARGENLQMCPQAWTDVRTLLAHIRQSVQSIGEMIGRPECCSLGEVIEEMRRQIAMQQGHALAQEAAHGMAALAPVECEPYPPPQVATHWICSGCGNVVPIGVTCAAKMCKVKI